MQDTQLFAVLNVKLFTSYQGFLGGVYEQHMDLNNQLGLQASRPLSVHQSVLLGKNFSTGRNIQTFQPNSFIPVMLEDTIDLYCFRPLSVILTLARGHKISTKQILLASFSLTVLKFSN